MTIHRATPAAGRAVTTGQTATLPVALPAVTGRAPSVTVAAQVARSRATSGFEPSRQSAAHPAVRRIDTTGIATALYAACQSSDWGLQATEDQLFSGLRQLRSPTQGQQLMRDYQAHFHESLVDHTSKELTGKDEQRARLFLHGRWAEAEVIALEQALPGFSSGSSGSRRFHGLRHSAPTAGGQAAAVSRVFEGKSAAEISQVLATFELKHQASVDSLVTEKLGGADRVQVWGQIRGRPELVDAALLDKALGAPGDDHRALWQVMDGAGAQRMSAAQAAYQQAFGRSLTAQLETTLTGADRERALALLTGDQPQADAARLQGALQPGTSTSQKLGVLQGLFDGRPEYREQVLSAYQGRYGQGFQGRASQQLSPDAADAMSEVLAGKKVSLSQQLRLATADEQVDCQAVLELLADKTPGQISKLRADYRAQYRVDLNDDVFRLKSGDQRSRLQGLDELDVQHALNGVPSTPQQALDRLKARATLAARGSEQPHDDRLEVALERVQRELSDYRRKAQGPQTPQVAAELRQKAAQLNGVLEWAVKDSYAQRGPRWASAMLAAARVG